MFLLGFPWLPTAGYIRRGIYFQYSLEGMNSLAGKFLLQLQVVLEVKSFFRFFLILRMKEFACIRGDSLRRIFKNKKSIS